MGWIKTYLEASIETIYYRRRKTSIKENRLVKVFQGSYYYKGFYIYKKDKKWYFKDERNEEIDIEKVSNYETSTLHNAKDKIDNVIEGENNDIQL